MDEWKRSGQIPAFGNWDMANDLPITQYFECARQAGLVRFSSSSGETGGGDRDLYTPDSNKHAPIPYRNTKNHNIPYSNLKHKQGTRNRERRCQHESVVVAKEKGNNNNNNNNNKKGVNVATGKKQGRVYDDDVVPEQARKPTTMRVRSKQLNYGNDTVPRSPPRRAPKPVDEDLYKIPPELLHTTKRKRMLGFISKCLVPAACVS